MNLLWAFGYNAVALTLAVSGLLQPVFAAALMAGSSAVIVFRSLHAARATVRGSTSKGPSAKVTAPRRLEA
jgi:Cu2+-exporting ATPase